VLPTGSIKGESGLRVIGDIVSTLVILGSVILLVIWFASDLEREYAGTHMVIDGDSIIINNEKIRLDGIDAPELHQECSKNGVKYQCGIKARNYLRSLLRQGNLSCKAWERDKYERHLGHCVVGKIDINKKMVSDGWAVAFGSYYSEEKNARDAAVGLWAGDFVRPREWRLAHGRVTNLN